MNYRKILILTPAVVIFAIFIYNFLFLSRTPSPGMMSYKRHCANCHGEQGEGVRQLIPPLKNSDYAAKWLDSLPCWLTNGMSHAVIVNGKLYEQSMYPIREIGDVELANIMNYVDQEFLGRGGNRYSSAWADSAMRACK